MPRPRKWRRVCALPLSAQFGPLSAIPDTLHTVSMTVDEYETIRLIDMERLTQEECALRMNIARSTVQGIYDTARRKLADSLINGKALIIGGGEYILCDGMQPHCGSCQRHRRRGRRWETEKEE